MTVTRKRLVTGFQTGKVIGGNRGDQNVALRAGKAEKLASDPGAEQMFANILLPSAASAITAEAGRGIQSAELLGLSQYVERFASRVGHPEIPEPAPALALEQPLVGAYLTLHVGNEGAGGIQGHFDEHQRAVCSITRLSDAH